ncbi:MAG: FtsW/RodA/SpoVE family cell cycle protein [Treponema sp.]|nr:FtsW/RodA/SpoVE family cell cycle protein [Treponema sp.]
MGFSGKEHGAVRYDFILIAIVLLLTLLGLVILYSASYLFALNQPQRFNNGWAPLTGNLAACIMMLAIFPILALVRIEWLKKEWMVIFLVLFTIILNILPLLRPLRRDGYAMRWIIIREGIGFQPSELIKIVLPLYLAYILDKNNDKLNSFMYGPLPPIVVTALFCTLVLIQSNFSDAALIAFTSMIICFIAGIRLRWFVLALAAILPIIYKLTFGNKDGRWYQRIAGFFSREESPPDLRTQIDFSLEAIRSGGFWGKGIGQGTIKVRVPEVHGDFVFASFVEETGFLGVLFYLVLIGAFAAIGYMVAWRNKNRFIQFLAFGLVTPILIQTLLNIAVVARIIPTTGVPLPFVSSGGTSLLATLVSAALLVNMARQHINSEMGGDYAR